MRRWPGTRAASVLRSQPHRPLGGPSRAGPESPRTYIGQLPLAREAVRNKQEDKLRFLYGSVPDTLSQLIRTSFVASEGNKLVDADFSAIEARVISWLAGEQWRLEVFRTHGKIYEASASPDVRRPAGKN